MLKKPNAVKNLKCVAMDLEKGFVVTWDCSSGATSYQIERKKVLKGKTDKTEEIFIRSNADGRKGNIFIFNDTSTKISATSEYRYVITAMNTRGSSGSRTTKDTKPGTCPQGSITKLVADVARTAEINLSWEAVSRANQYHVYYQKTSSKTTLITKVASTSAILKRASIEGGFVYVEPANGWGESKGAIRLWLAIDGKKVSTFTK